MKTYAYAYDPPDCFEDRVNAYAKANGVKVFKVVTDAEIPMPRGPNVPTRELVNILDDMPCRVLTLDGAISHPDLPYADDAIADEGGEIIDMRKRIPTKRKAKPKAKKPLETVSERLLRGRVNSAKKGYHQTGPAPYGYRRDYSSHPASPPILVPEPEEALVVRECFRYYLRLRSMKRLVAHLNGQGLRTRRGKEWSRAGIAWILKNETYLGRVHFGDVRASGKHQALVSPIIFNKVQVLIRKNDKRNRET